MKLEIYTLEGWLPIINRQSYFTSYEYDGLQTLSFDVSARDDIFKNIKNEVLIRNDENMYIIKKIDKRSINCTVTCDLYMDAWMETKPYVDTKNSANFQTKTLSEVLDFIKPADWTIQNANIKGSRQTLEFDNATPYDILIACQKIYDVVYKIDALHHTIYVLNPDKQTDTGLYITPELNMTNLEYTGDSKDFVTRISAYGKQNEDGTYVNFAAINGGKDYVENTSYKGKIKWIIWKDEQLTNPDDLLTEAKKKLKKQSFPIMSYTVGVNDLARYNDDYRFLDFELYNVAHTILDEHTSIIQTIIKIKRYHDQPEKNEITLSSVPQKITSSMDKVATILGEDGTNIINQTITLIDEWAQKGYTLITGNEIYIVDKLPKEHAVNCMRMNREGISFSKQGFDGPYTSAWTMDGSFNANFIKDGIIKNIPISNGANFKIDENGNMNCHNATIASGVFQGSINTNENAKIGSTLMLAANQDGQSAIHSDDHLQNGEYAIFLAKDRISIAPYGTTAANNSIDIGNNGVVFHMQGKTGITGTFTLKAGTKLTTANGIVTGVD